MKTLLLTLILCAQAFGAGFFAGQQGVVASQSVVYWTPSDLGSSVVYAWAEASSFTDTDGTDIATWGDLSGNARNWTQSTSSKKPTEQTYGGFRVARFDSVDDGMSGSISVSTNNFTVIACYRYASTVSALRRAVQGSANWLIGPYSGSYQYYDGRGFVTSGPSVTTNFAIHSVSQFSASTPDSSHWLNGTLAGSVTHSGSVESVTPGFINMGASGAWAEPLGGDIYGLIILSGTDTDNRQKCEGYFAWKVGIQSSLDASHPYRTSPP